MSAQPSILQAFQPSKWNRFRRTLKLLESSGFVRSFSELSTDSLLVEDGDLSEVRHMLRLASAIVNEHCNDVSWTCRESEDFTCLAEAEIDMCALCFDSGPRPRSTCPFNKCIDPKTWASALIVIQRYSHKIESIRTFCEHLLHMFENNNLPDAAELASLLLENTPATEETPHDEDSTPQTYHNVIPLIGQYFKGGAMDRFRERLPGFILTLDHIANVRLLSDVNVIWDKITEDSIQELQQLNYISPAFTSGDLASMTGLDLDAPCYSRMWVGGVYTPLPPSRPHNPNHLDDDVLFILRELPAAIVSPLFVAATNHLGGLDVGLFPGAAQAGDQTQPGLAAAGAAGLHRGAATTRTDTAVPPGPLGGLAGGTQMYQGGVQPQDTFRFPGEDAAAVIARAARLTAASSEAAQRAAEQQQLLQQQQQ